jgi:tetratricopeptide (TPR) repeat protein
MPKKETDDGGIAFDDQPDGAEIRNYYNLPSDEEMQDQYQERLSLSGQRIADANETVEGKRSAEESLAIIERDEDDLDGNTTKEANAPTPETEGTEFLEQKVGDVMQYVHWLNPDMKLGDIDILDLISIPCYLRITMEQFEQWSCKGIAKEIKEDIKVFNRILQYKIPNAEEMGMTVKLDDDENKEDKTTDSTNDSSDSQDKIAKRDRLYKALFAKISEAENMLDLGERDQAIDCLTRVDEMRMTLELEEDDRSVMVLGRTAVGLYKSGEEDYSIRYLEEATEIARKSENSAYLLLFLAACYTFVKKTEDATAILKDLPDAEKSKEIIKRLVDTEEESGDTDNRSNLPLAA